MAHNVVLLAGDGIGPEVADATKRVLAAAGADIHWIERAAGVAALDTGADSVLPPETVEAIRKHGVALGFHMAAVYVHRTDLPVHVVFVRAL